MVWRKPIITLSLLLLMSTVLAEPGHRMMLGHFSQQADRTLPVGWDPITFGRVEKHTTYRLVTERQHVVLKAESDAAASGLTYKVRFDPKRYPYLVWRWKVDKALQHSDVTSKSGDDYPVRLYVSFDYDVNRLPAAERSRIDMYYLLKGVLPPLATLNYIWARQAPIGKIIPSPYTDRVRMVVLKNRRSKTQHWHYEERNILADYQAAFGEAPGDVISVAIMTDTDNAGEKTTSYYGDIFVSKTATLTDQAP